MQQLLSSDPGVAPAVASEGKSILTPDRLVYLAIFAVSLTINVWFNFFTVHPDCATACDASEYLRDAHGLLAYGQLCFGEVARQIGLNVPQVGPAALANLKELCQGGVVFPAFIAACFFISNSNATVAPVFAQCVLAALAAVFVAATATYAWNRSTGVVAGILQAIYPGFIIGTGRLYSESFSVFLFACVIWLSVRGFRTRSSLWQLIALGAGLYSLQLTRSVFALLALVCAPIAIAQQRGMRALATAALLAGLVAVLIPWFALQKAALGNASFFVNRVGQYNAFIGSNVDSQGWLSLPYQNGVGVEKQSITTIITDGVKESPWRWTQLMFDKPVRLLKFPWNDFRLSIGPIPPAVQVAIHQLLLALGLIGIPLTMAQPASKAKRRSQLLLLATVPISLTYLAFITVPRYNIQIEVVAIMFAASAICAVPALFKKVPVQTALFIVSLLACLVVFRAEAIPYLMYFAKGIASALAFGAAIKALALIATCAVFCRLLAAARPGHRTARLAAMLLAFIALPFVSLPLRAHGRPGEWRHPFDHAGQVIEQSISIPSKIKDELATKQAYLLIDADGINSLSNGCAIEVNGVPIHAPVIPGLAAMQNYSRLRHVAKHAVYWEGEYIFGCMATLAQQSNADLRQWFLVPVPPEVFGRLKSPPGSNISAPNTKVRTGATTSSNGEVSPAMIDSEIRVVLRRTGSIPGAAIYGMYRNDKSKIDIPSIDRYSWEKAFYGVESDSALTDTRLDGRADVHTLWRSADLSDEPGLQNGAFSVRLLVDDSTGDSHLLKIADSRLQFQSENHPADGWNIDLKNLPEYNANDQWFCQLRVNVPPGVDYSKAHCTIFSDDNGELVTYQSPWFPRSFSGSDCEYTIPIMPQAMPGKLSCLRLNFLGNNGTLSDVRETTKPPVVTAAIWRRHKAALLDSLHIF